MFVREWNKEGNKKALLLHGLASSSVTWRRLAKDLIENDYHVIAPDLKGHGKSGWAGSYSVEQWSKDIMELGLITPDLVVGHSMGGLIIANIYDYLKPKNVVLIDPMFNYPRNRFIGWSVKTAFKNTLKRAHRKEILPQAEAFGWTKKDIKLAFKNGKNWDGATANTLQYRPDILKRFLPKANNTLILRAKGSFIVPRNWEQKLQMANIKFLTMPASHNMHIDIYKDFWLETRAFLGLA